MWLPREWEGAAGFLGIGLRGSTCLTCVQVSPCPVAAPLLLPGWLSLALLSIRRWSPSLPHHSLPGEVLQPVNPHTCSYPWLLPPFDPIEQMKYLDAAAISVISTQTSWEKTAGFVTAEIWFRGSFLHQHVQKQGESEARGRERQCSICYSFNSVRKAQVTRDDGVQIADTHVAAWWMSFKGPRMQKQWVRKQRSTRGLRAVLLARLH